MKVKNKVIVSISIIIIAIIAIPSIMHLKPGKVSLAEEEKPKIRIAGDNNFPPYEYLDDKGIYKGFNIDIMKAIAEDMDVEIELIPMRWADAVLALENGQIDAIQGMSKTSDREEKYKFTQATIVNSSGIFIKKGNEHIQGIEDLKGSRIAYQVGDINEEKIKNIPYAILVARYNQIDGIQALLDDEADAFIGNKAVVIYRLNKMKKTNKIKLVGEPVGETSYGPVTLPENTDVYAILNGGLSLIKYNGTYDKIYKRWFGDQLSHSQFALRNYLKEILIIIGIILFTILGFIIWNRRLQIEVTKRTEELEKANKDLRTQQKRIYNLAYYDNITNLPNRLYFVEDLEKTIENLEDGEMLIVLYFDLDRFKHINDTLGYAIGDEVLKLVGERLQAIGKNNILARISGDSYIMSIRGIRSQDETLKLAEKFIEDFKEPIVIGEHKLYLTTSIGIATFPQAGSDSISLMKNAEVALYKAKDLGGNSYFKYNEEIGKQEYTNLNTLNELREAVNNEQFVLYYQPKIDIRTKEIVGMEALIRWQNPEKGLIFPDKFIPLAEDTGLIFSIGEWVLKEACRQNKEWIDKGYRPRRISVNISPRQFQYYNFLESISNTLEETGLEPECLGLEITETMVISDIEYTINVLRELRELGVFVVMDDFGTGYSSLSYLKEMSINELKIDRAFIRDIDTNEKNRAISNTIILLANQFNILVTAEGVETKEQLEILEELGCDKAQGYYFSKPIPKEEFEKLLD